MGFYLAIALVAYALAGALFNDLYLPGRRTPGLHLHYDAIPPALLAIALYALTLPLVHFRRSAWLDRFGVALKIGAVISLSFTLYAIANPAGRKLATTEECQATFSKLAVFTNAFTSDRDLHDYLQTRGLQCDDAPILKSYHDCVARARKAADVNSCHGESQMLFERKNAT